MKCMSWISRLILVTSLMMNSAGISSAVAAISLSPDKGALNESGQDKKMDATARANAEAAYAKLPLSFEANKGQTDASVKFLARGKGYTLFLTPSEAVLSLKGAQEEVVRMSMNGANANPLVQGLDILPSKSNYMTGDRSKWHTNVKQYSKVEYKQVYKGIDVVYYGNQGQLEYDFVVSPGANPGLIKMDFQGAKSIELDKQGNLVLNLKEGKLAFNAPLLYQKTGDTREPVDGRFVLAGNNQVCFEVGTYDKSKELVIDPTIQYSTYLGTTVEDRINAMQVDAAGNVYMTGQTATVADKFPGTASSPIQPANNGGAFDAFVIKLSPSGAILWATYLGGAGDDIGNSIAVDGAGIVYISGSTTFTAGVKYPTANAYQAVNNGGTDAFVTAVAANGNSLVYSTFLGGAGEDFGYGIAVDAAGNAYVTGGTTSNNILFPQSPGAKQGDNAGASDAFVTKFSPAGVRAYSTFLGGTTADIGRAIAIDGVGNAYVTGQAADAFPIFPLVPPTAFKLTITGAYDAFITKVNPTGTDWLYSTYVGGSGIDDAFGIALDGADPATLRVYITGYTFSADMPKPGSGFANVGQTTIGTAPDSYVFKLNMNGGGSNLDGVYFTYLGGSTDDRANTIKVDANGNAYVTGRTTSGDFVSVSPASIQTPFDSTLGATGKAFVTVIGPDGSTRLWNTFIGGVTDQEGKGIGLDAGHNIYVAGWTNSTGFPTAVPLYAANAGDKDGFIMKFSPASSASLPAITSVNPTFGTTAGGTSVIIYGTGFTGVNSVKFDIVNAASYVVNSSTQITAISPAHTASVVHITVTTPAGTSNIVNEDRYTYYDLPVITGVIPPGGTPAGGTSVVITGTGFTGVSSIKFDVLDATSYTVDSSTQITATTPAHAVGIVHITATNPVGTSTTGDADIYTYTSGTSSPTITSVNPPGGSSAGGTTVVITGTGFTGITAANGVKFGAVNAASYTVNSSTQITAISPEALIAGTTVDIRVTSLDGISPIVLGDIYTYVLGTSSPTIISINPPGGIPAGGTTVVITGTGFTGVTAANGVKFGDVNATSYTVNTSSQITAIAPAHAVGIVDIRVTSLNGISSIVPEDVYTYASGTSSPTISGITPKVGPTVGGTTVVITGTGFTGITAANGVKFGDLNAASYVVNSNTQITAVTKAHAVGIVDVRVTSLGGLSPIVSEDKFTYFLTPVTPLGVVAPFDPYIFPSPTRGNTANLAYYMYGPGTVDFRIYNEIGELVKYLLDESKPAGAQGSSINVGKMAPGVYYCLLNIDYDDGTKKHYKLKFAVIH